MDVLNVCTVPFAQVPNALLEDDRLSWKAKGLWCYLQSRPSGWTVRLSDLTKRSKDGRASVRTAADELEAAGWLTRKRIRDESGSGQFDKTEWTLQSGAIKQVNPKSDFPTLDNPTLGNPTSDNRTLSNTDLSNTDLSNTEGKEPAAGRTVNPWDEFREVWNGLAERHGWRMCKFANRERTAAFNARWKRAEWRDAWRAALEGVGNDPFYGGANGREWQANVDWFLRPNTVSGIIEKAEAQSRMKSKNTADVRDADQKAGGFRL